MLTVGLLAVVVYLYTVVAFNFFRKFYNKSEDGELPDMKCDDMLTVSKSPLKLRFHCENTLRHQLKRQLHGHCGQNKAYVSSTKFSGSFRLPRLADRWFISLKRLTYSWPVHSNIVSISWCLSVEGNKHHLWVESYGSETCSATGSIWASAELLWD